MARIHLIYFDIETGYTAGVNHGLASLAAAVRQQGHHFSFHHLTSCEPINAVIQKARGQDPEIIGFSFTSTQKKFVTPYADALKGAMGVIQIAGGVHPTIAPEEVLNMGFFSGVAIGDAEKSLPELLLRIDHNDDISSVHGFWWQGKDGVIQRNPIPPLDSNLANIPMPDYSIFNTDAIAEENSGWISVMLTRGCPYNCYYCCNHVLREIYPIKKDYVRLPSVEYAIKLIENGMSFYSEVKGINFADDLLIFNQAWFLQFAKLYKEYVGLHYTCNGRIEHCSDEVIIALKESGCSLVHLGIESGSEWLRHNILNRHPSNQQIIDTFSRLRQAKINTLSYNIVGFPFETEKHMKETLAINKFVKPDMGAVFYFYPFPGTKLFNTCKEYDLLLELDEELAPSGYRERFMIKDIHCSEVDCKKVYQKICIFLFSRRLVSSLNLPNIFGTFIYWISPVRLTD